MLPLQVSLQASSPPTLSPALSLPQSTAVSKLRSFYSTKKLHLNRLGKHQQLLINLVLLLRASSPDDLSASSIIQNHL